MRFISEWLERRKERKQAEKEFEEMRQQMLISMLQAQKSLNMNFAIAMRNSFQSHEFDMDDCFLNMASVKCLCENQLAKWAEKLQATITDSFHEMPIRFIQGETAKGFVIELPDVKYMADIGVMGFLKYDDARTEVHYLVYEPETKSYSYTVHNGQVVKNMKATPQTTEELIEQMACVCVVS